MFKRISPKHLKTHGIPYKVYKERGYECYSEEELKKYKEQNSGVNNPNYGNKKLIIKWQDPKYREKVRVGVSKSMKKRINLHGAPFAGKKHSLATKAQISNSVKEKWKDEKYAAKALSANLKANGISPNKKELKLLGILNSVDKGVWEYVGNGKLIVGGKCPDYVSKNEPEKLLELFGDYWHKGQNPQDRIDFFEKYGYKCLVIWENELKKEGLLKEKLKTVL